MSSTVDSPKPDNPFSPFRWLSSLIRNRIFAGLMVALPIAITFWIVWWLYSTLREVVIDPVARLLMRVSETESPDNKFPAGTPDWFKAYIESQNQTDGLSFVAPIFAFIIVLLLLYFLGLFFQSRLHKIVDWFLLSVPGVTTIYKAVSNVFASISQSGETQKFKRVVLIKFPHPGIQVPAFVTSTCIDERTGKNILCVYVPTTPVPTSGYMLMVPEEDVSDLEWDMNETLQAIVSGGITVPEKVDYFDAVEDAKQQLSDPHKESE